MSIFDDILNIKTIKAERDTFKQSNLFLLEKKKVLEKEIEELKKNNEELKEKMETLGIFTYEEILEKINVCKENLEIDNKTIETLKKQIEDLEIQIMQKEKNLKTNVNKISKVKAIYNSMEYSIEKFFSENIEIKDYVMGDEAKLFIEELTPSVILKLNCMNIRDLQKAYRDNEKDIDKLTTMYSDRYTTKANKTIYSLMVIALRAELQNILIDLRHEKLEKAIESVKTITGKYLKIAGDGNQSILGTLTKFIGEIEYLFINAVKIEYNYYVKKEQARQEQLAIREQMKQEKEERMALEQEKKKIEKEELKYKNELEKINLLLENNSDSDEMKKLQEKILELESKLSEVVVQKEEIVNLQNGKAGTVYVISNLGAFGDDVFKIGMTRRLEPQDRINELGDASVPFKFDVHSFIFSEDAVELETKLHRILNEKRLNKVNRRKEFFKIDIDELEKIIMKIDATAEFKKTMLAEEFRQSLSSDNVYEDDYIVEYNDEECCEE